MMTQSVMTQAANLLAETAGNVNVKGKKSDSGFNLVIDSRMKVIQKTAAASDTRAVKKASVQTSDEKDSSQSDSTDSSKVQADNGKTKTVTKADTSKAADQKSAIKSDTKTTDQDITDDAQSNTLTANSQVTDQITAMLQNIQEAVMKALNLTSDEFNQLLTSQGMSTADLLQPEKLQQLVLANSGKTDILAALTDENLADTMKQLLQTVNEIKDQSNTGLTSEQIKSMLAQVNSQAKAQKETSAKVPAASKQDTVSQDETVKQAEVVNTANVTEDDKDGTVNTKTVTEKNISTVAAKTAVTGESLNNSQSGNSKDEAGNNLDTSNEFQTFVDNLVKASTTAQADFSGEVTQVTDVREIANQIIDKIKVSVTQNQTSMELQLNPESLGKVNLTVQSKGGVMTAHFVVQNEISREAIESQMQTLRDTLTQQGIKVDAIEVTVSANSFEQNSNESSNSQAETQKGSSGRKITLEEAVSMDNAAEDYDESPAKDVSGLTGGLVDYTA